VKNELIRGRAKTGTYRSLFSAIGRCYNPRDKQYKDYGGRGIYVEDYFRGLNGFQHFLDYIGERPEGMSLDRYPDNDGSYVRGNIRWATPKEQAANTRNLHWFVAVSPLDIVFVSNNQAEFARQYDLDQSNISACLCGKRKQTKGWEFKRET
jgi:hypothetical protein